MEAAGLGVGVIGLVSLFSTCLDILEKWDSYRDFGFESGSIRARFVADRVRFRQWGQHVGISQGKEGQYHRALEDPSVRSAIDLILYNIKNIEGDAEKFAPHLALFSDSASFLPESNAAVPTRPVPFEKSNMTTSRRNRLGWALRGKARALTLVGSFDVLVQKLHDLVPLSMTTIEKQTASKWQGKASTESADSWKDDTQKILFDLEKQIHNETRKELRDWLDASDTKRTYDDLVLRRLDGTCDWILGRPEIKKWQSFAVGNPKILWINGPAGYGKTILCARLVEHISVTSQTYIAYFFFSSEIESRADPFVVVKSLISQLLTQKEAFDLTREKWEATDGRTASRKDIKELFITLLQNLPPCAFVVDGLDECAAAGDISGSDHQGSLLEFLKFFTHAISNSKSQLLIMSRNDLRIKEGLSCDKSQLVELQICPKDVEADASVFSQNIVNRKLSNKSETQREELTHRLVHRCESMFLAIKLLEDDLRGGKNLKQLQRAIDQAPNKLDHIYDRNWERIQRLENSSRSRALSILRWATFAIRPLSVLEITECLLLQDAECDEIDYEELPDSLDEVYVKTEILELCGSLIDIRAEPSLDLETVDYLVEEMGLEVDQVGFSNQTALLVASAMGYVSGTTQLLEKGANVNAVDREESTPLHFAVYFGHVEVARLLLDYGGELTAKDNDGWTPLHFAAVHGHVAVLNLLLERGGDVHALDHDGCTPLYWASRRGHSDAVKLLLEKGSGPDVRSSYGSTPLVSASLRRHTKVVNLLLRAGADPQVSDNRGWTALHEASDEGHTEVVQLLLKGGADPCVRGAREATPLFYASRNARLDVVKLLLDSGSDLYAIDALGQTAWGIAAELGFVGVVRLFLEKGLSVESSESASGRSLLSFAASSGQIDLVEYLLQHSANPNSRDNFSRTPLFYAATSGNLSLFNLVLSQGGGSINSTDVYGSGLLSIAVRHGHIDLVAHLLSCDNIDLNSKDNFGRPVSFWTTASFLQEWEVPGGAMCVR
ncbi:hypothetical protein E0Z10_g1488 [Xylaria hypoxylon]|uniref:NACHT domain-containing protein n=1 Tax=Xylaria hypoxylon TaxID=37992 RepID=A0A4Z0YTD0_9PEZI|nr:hypothetical protein E0Z10_g1488 [Xylaria hypoxylon]